MLQNVFEEIGFNEQSAANLKLRARLMMIIANVIQEDGLTQKDAARIFGVSQPRVSDLMRGKIERFTIDALVNMLATTGRGIRLESESFMDKAVDDIRVRVSDLMRRHGVVRAGLFGSVARGEATESSDVDFLVEFENGRSLLDLAGLRLDLAEALHRDVDVTTPESLHPEMMEQVQDDLVPIL